MFLQVAMQISVLFSVLDFILFMNFPSYSFYIYRYTLGKKCGSKQFLAVLLPTFQSN